MIAAIAGLVVASGLLAFVGYPWLCRRSARRDEATAVLPGDDIVRRSTVGYTLATTIDAEPGVVWPWLLQLGQGRGGFYTHEWVESLLGADIRNADRIVPELQTLRVGDRVFLTPDPYLGRPGQYLEVARVRDRELLGLCQRLPNGATGSWTFVLVPMGRVTRLLFRRRSERASLFDRAMMPGYYFMDRGMLAGLKQRAEGRRGRGVGSDRTFEECP